MSQPITRKTLALRCCGDMNVDRIRKNERVWGLREARANTGTRAVLYDRERAIEILRRRKLA